MARIDANLIPLGDVTQRQAFDSASGDVLTPKRSKKDKKREAKELRKRQQEQKKFNRAMKIKKKQADNQGVLFNPEKAKREIPGEMPGEEKSEKDRDNRKRTKELESDAKAGKKDKKTDTSSSWSESDSSDPDSEIVGGAEIEAKPSSKKRQRDDFAESLPFAKRAKQDYSSGPKERKTPKSNGPRLNMDLITPESTAARVKKENNRVKSNMKQEAKLEKIIAEGRPQSLIAVGLKKPKTKKDETSEQKAERRARRAEKKAKIEAEKANPVKAEHRANITDNNSSQTDQKKAEKLAKRLKSKAEKETSKGKKGMAKVDKNNERAKVKNESISHGNTGRAQQWNAEALSGGAERQEKFRRLLGAGKANGQGRASDDIKTKSNVDIEKVQSELEKQFQAGVKMKHEQGGRKRGLGA